MLFHFLIFGQTVRSRKQIIYVPKLLLFHHYFFISDAEMQKEVHHAYLKTRGGLRHLVALSR